MKVLVTGSSGRIGAAVVEALLAQNHAVRGFDLRASARTADHYEEITGSLDDAEAVENAVFCVDAVLHLGAFMSWAPQDKAKMFSANVEGTRLLADAASAAGARRFVFASSGEVYPENAPLSLPVTEDHPLNANSPYGLTKLLGEEIVRFHQRAGKMETVILRFSHTQDASELLDEGSFFSGPRFFLQPRIKQQENFGNHAVAEILRKLDTGESAHILTRNENGRPYRMHITDTRDMVQGLLLALEHEEAAGQVFNLGATDPVYFETLLPHMSDITGLPIIIADLPGQGVYYQTSNDKIRRILGYEPVWTIERMVKVAGKAWRTRRSM